MSAKQLLNAIGNACGLDNLQFDAQGCAKLLIDGKLGIQLEHNDTDERIYIYSSLGTIPVTDRETVFRRLLESNLFGHDTGGATLAIDRLQNDFILWQAIAINQTTPEDMSAIVERFINAAETWQARLNDLPVPDTLDTTHSRAGMSAALRV